MHARAVLSVVLSFLMPGATPCADDNGALAALGLSQTCADMARLSQGAAVANHRTGLCSLLHFHGLLDLCCASCSAIDECASVPCANDGECSDGLADYQCVCQTGWTGPTCAIEFIVPDECPESTYILAANSSIDCVPPQCVAINDGTEFCNQCSVCGTGFTHIDDCIRTGANGTDGHDTVCSRTRPLLAMRATGAP